jgi:ribosomal protein L11 methyltransferase
MKDPLFLLRLEDTSKDPRFTEELLDAAGFSFSSWTDVETGRVEHSYYANTHDEAEWVRARISERSEEWEASYGIQLEPLPVETISFEEWSEGWKAFFQPQRISPRLAICPSWCEYEPVSGERVLSIDPGMSFGTGRHATTRFCLSMIDQASLEKRGRFLDAGCGSGILLIAAAKLDFDEGLGFDNDPKAVEIACENLAVNGVSESRFRAIHADFSDIAATGIQYDFVAANILAPVLIANGETISRLVVPGGFLALAGILVAEYDSVSDCFLKEGFEEIETRFEEDWRGGLFRKTNVMSRPSGSVT